MRVRYITATDAQCRWGGNRDPRGVLTEGETYVVLEIVPTVLVDQYVLENHPEGLWNSSCFEIVEP